MVRIFLTVRAQGRLALATRLPLSPKNSETVNYQHAQAVVVYSESMSKGCRDAPDLALIAGGVILFIVTEFELLTVIHLLVKTWKDDHVCLHINSASLDY